MKVRLMILFLMALLGPASAVASIFIGSGFSTFTSGRAVPGGLLGFQISSFAISGYSTGVATPLYYQSAWTLGGYKMWQSGEILSGPVKAGFGLAFYYTRRGYRPDPSSDLATTDDFGGGPAFRVIWNFIGPAFVGVEALFGLRDPFKHLLLSSQEAVNVSLGVEF